MQRHLTTKRARFLAAVALGLMAVFVVRLAYMQIIRHDYYVSQADSEQIKQFVLHAQRGEIYALDGSTPTKLVMNETVYTVWADPMVVTEVDKVVEVMNRVAGGNVRDNFRQYLTRQGSRYQVIANKVSRKQAELIKKEKLAGIGFDAVTQRVYPEGQLASQVLGFVDASGVGRYGFEQANDKVLRGTDGVLKTVTDVRSVPLTIGNKNIKQPARNGTNMVLTIDRNVQAKVEQALRDGARRTGATHVSAVVMNPQNGRVMAMANLPTYDPSQLAKVTDVSSLNNNTITNPYEPGSDIKTFTVATGIDKGVITPQSTYNNTDKIKVDDITIGNASKGQTGNITMQHALNWSLNTGMVTVAQRLGNGRYITRQARDTMYEYFHDRFRLGQLTGIELAGEAKGNIISPTQQQGNAVRYSNMSFGQGMDVTMLQVSAGFSAMINGGTYYAPTVIAGTIDGKGTFSRAAAKTKYTNIIKPQSSDTVREMVHQARKAFYAGNDTPGFYIGGKTGTSQTIENGKYIYSQTVGTYLGFGGEVGKIPSYVIMVEVSGKGMALQGGQDALPIFTDISNWMINYLQLQPKG